MRDFTSPSIGIELIERERARQISVEGYYPSEDPDYYHIAAAAAAYALSASWQPFEAAEMWPWAPELFKPKDPLRDLVRAGALIAAAIDRLKLEENMEASDD